MRRNTREQNRYSCHSKIRPQQLRNFRLIHNLRLLNYFCFELTSRVNKCEPSARQLLAVFTSVVEHIYFFRVGVTGPMK
jgi:hypothetical protein